MPGIAWSMASKINRILEGFQLVALSRPQFPEQGIWWKTAQKKKDFFKKLKEMGVKAAWKIQEDFGEMV